MVDKKKSNIIDLKSLRNLAEKRVKLQKNFDVAKLSASDIERLIYELSIHQIELGMQNEALRENELKLNETLTRYNELYDFSPAGYITLNSDGLILETNLTFAQMLSTKKENLIGNKFYLYIHQETQDDFYLYLSNIVKSQIKMSCDLRLQSHNILWVGVDGVAKNNGNKNIEIYLSLSDVSKLKDNRVELIKSRQAQQEQQQLLWYKTILNNLEEGVITIEPDDNIIFMNNKAQNLTGWEVEEAKGKKISEVFQITSRGYNSQSIDNIIANKYTCLLLSKCGQMIPITYNKTFIKNENNGSKFGAVLIFN